MRILFIVDNVKEFILLNRQFLNKGCGIDFEWLPLMIEGYDLSLNDKKRYDLIICDVIGTSSPQDFWYYYHKIEKMCKKVIVTSGGHVSFPAWFKGEFVSKSNLVEYLKLLIPKLEKAKDSLDEV